MVETVLGQFKTKGKLRAITQNTQGHIHSTYFAEFVLDDANSVGSKTSSCIGVASIKSTDTVRVSSGLTETDTKQTQDDITKAADLPENKLPINKHSVRNGTTEQADTVRVKRYVLQRLNTSIFKEPDKLMNNIYLVTSHLKREVEKRESNILQETLQIIKTKDDKLSFKDEDLNCWRLYDYIEDSYTPQENEGLETCTVRHTKGEDSYTPEEGGSFGSHVIGKDSYTPNDAEGLETRTGSYAKGEDSYTPKEGKELGTRTGTHSIGKDSYTPQEGGKLDEIYESGKAFGNFHELLKDFDPLKLTELLPDFHNTPKRYQNLVMVWQQDQFNRAKDAKTEFAYLQSLQDIYGKIVEAGQKGELPLKVVHNDAKMSNVLLSTKTGKPLAVIDLDTIGPGYTPYDFGDAIRSGAATAKEDEADLNKVKFNLQNYKIFAAGFISGSNNTLTQKEIELLPYGALIITLEQAMRFLTDYLQNDAYYQTAYAQHNLVRCQNQIKLAQEMHKIWSKLQI